MIRPEDQISDGDSKPIHHISFVTVARTGGKILNVPMLKARFQELIPTTNLPSGNETLSARIGDIPTDAPNVTVSSKSTIALVTVNVSHRQSEDVVTKADFVTTASSASTVDSTIAGHMITKPSEISQSTRIAV